jgi:hypothetical protein
MCSLRGTSWILIYDFVWSQAQWEKEDVKYRQAQLLYVAFFIVATCFKTVFSIPSQKHKILLKDASIWYPNCTWNAKFRHGLVILAMHKSVVHNIFNTFYVLGQQAAILDQNMPEYSI